MNDAALDSAKRLYKALTTRSPIAPLTQANPDMTLEDAYRVSRQLLKLRMAAGEKVVGKKIGITSVAVQQMLGIETPDFGFLTDLMQVSNGATIDIAESLIAPKVEGEIAFILKRPLQGPGVTADDVMGATAGLAACFEIVDSRIRDWQIQIQDTVADNASCGMFVIGEEVFDPKHIDIETCGMVVEINDEVAATGAGAACLGSPAIAVAWLTNQLSQYEIELQAGEIILSGSLVPFLPANSGDRVHIRSGVGTASLQFF